MTRAVASGMPKLRIEESAARRQAAVDRGDTQVVGVNAYRAESKTAPELRTIDNQAVRAAQIERLNQVRTQRDAPRCEGALERLRACAESGEYGLLEAAVEAALARATVGEISAALESVFGRHRAEVQSVSGVYAGLYADQDTFQDLRARVVAFAERAGRRPRVLVAKLGQDGHDRGAKTIATAFADVGFDVDLGALFQTPEEVARQAVDNDVHVIGISTQAAAHRTLLPALRERLVSLGAGEIGLVCGGVIPPDDYPMLKDIGVAEIFPPGTPVLDAAEKVLTVAERMVNGEG